MSPRINPRGYKSWRNSHRNDNLRDDVIKINKSCDCSYPTKNGKNGIHRVRNCRSRSHRRRNLGKKLNIPKLVYKFLGNVASLGSENNEVNSSRSNIKRSGIKKCKKHQRNSNSLNVKTNRETRNNEGSRSSISTCRSSETDSPAFKPSPSTAGSSTTSEMNTKRKFSIQAIKDYIKAGIAEGKRRAKKYMCKALSFGVDTGYLIPTDCDGQVLRVSSALVSFNAGQEKDANNGERGIRQRLRRGDASCTSKERKLLRRRDDVVSKNKRPRSPSSVGSCSSSTSSRKQSPRPKTKKAKYGNRIKRHKTKNSKRRKLKRGPGRPRGRISFGKIKAEKSCTSVELGKEENSLRNEDKNRLKETLTPSRSEEDNGKSIKKEKVSYPSIEEENSSEGREK